MKKIKKIILLFIVILILLFGFYIKLTLISNIKEIKLQESNNYKIYNLDNKLVDNEAIFLSITFDSKLKNKFIIPYIYNYSISSWFYDYSISIFWDFDDIDEIKTYFLNNNITISENIISNEKINKTLQYNWQMHFWSNYNNTFIKDIKNQKLKFVIEFKWIKDWKEDYYKIEKELDIEEKKYFWNSLIYILSRN